MSIKRYDMRGNTWPADDGNVVSYLDHSAVVAELEAICAELATENDKTSGRMQQLIQIISNADNDYCMCGDAMKNHVHGGCGHPTGMFDYHYNAWLQAGDKTPATDAFLAEVRAKVAEEALKIMGNFTSDECGDSVYIAIKEFAAQLRQEAK